MNLINIQGYKDKILLLPDFYIEMHEITNTDCYINYGSMFHIIYLSMADQEGVTWAEDKSWLLLPQAMQGGYDALSNIGILVIGSIYQGHHQLWKISLAMNCNILDMAWNINQSVCVSWYYIANICLHLHNSQIWNAWSILLITC